MTDNTRLKFSEILTFWLPLAATWLMMAAEGPFLAAVIARLAEPKYNLAAYGVAFSFALIFEAPVIMIMSASTALVQDRLSFRKLRNFTYLLSSILTGLILIALFPPVFNWVMLDLIRLPAPVARLTHIAMTVMIPWPGAIGYRRFYQGVLIRYNMTRRVAYGTLIRLITMSGSALFLFMFSGLDGAVVGASALSIGVCVEAIASRIMAHRTIQLIMTSEETEQENEIPINYRFITKFYYPLALTSMIGLGVHPIVTFFLGQSRMAVESLAVIPVVFSLTFIFMSIALSYQEVIISYLGNDKENYLALKNFAIVLGIFVLVAFSLLAFTPVSIFWLRKVSGLSPELAQFAAKPLKILVIMPLISVWLSFQRSVMVSVHRTVHVTIATIIEVFFIMSTLFVLVSYVDLPGAIAAAISLLAGRMGSNLYLIGPRRRALKFTKI